MPTNMDDCMSSTLTKTIALERRTDNEFLIKDNELNELETL